VIEQASVLQNPVMAKTAEGKLSHSVISHLAIKGK